MAKILVIDDDSMMLELYREILTRHGHEVVLAENGTQGLARAAGVDLVIVDLMMPNLNGYEFTKQLRTLDGQGQGSTPIIAASGLGTDELAFEAGADRFIRKPFRSQELIVLVDELLARGG
jgi:CheY-like chemotaxis protein